MVAEPRPASLENAARWKPTMSAPSAPPRMPSGEKAPPMIAPTAGRHLRDVHRDDGEAGEDVD
jgi:hypothetical protein